MKLSFIIQNSLADEIAAAREREFSAIRAQQRSGMTKEDIRQVDGVRYSEARLQKQVETSALWQKKQHDLNKAFLRAFALIALSILCINLYFENWFIIKLMLLIILLCMLFYVIQLYGPSIWLWLHQPFLGYCIGQVIVSCLTAIVLLGAIWWDFIRRKTTSRESS